jgi:hypothetical protein
MAVYHGLYLGMNANPIQDIKEASTTKKYTLGTFFDDEFGRRFRYVLNGASALTAGCIVQTAALGGATTTFQNVGVIGAQALVGATRVYVASITTLQAADVFADGWVCFEDTSLVSTYTHRIKSHTEIEHTTWVDAYMDLYEPLEVQLETTDFWSAIANPYKSVIPTVNATPTGINLGGANCAVAASSYCWIQTRGWFGAYFTDAAMVAGLSCQVGATTAGGMITQTETTFGQQVAWCPAAWAQSTGGLVYLKCE